MIKKTKAGIGAAAAGAILFALGVIKPFEGRELTPYYDIVGVLTWCDGETKGTPKTHYTDGECDSILAKSVAQYEAEIRPCLPAVLPDPVRGTFISAAYNLGSVAFCSSSMARKARAGDLRGACNALMGWNKGTFSKARAERMMRQGKVCTKKASGDYLCVIDGLTNRRKVERDLCLSGLQ